MFSQERSLSVNPRKTPSPWVSSCRVQKWWFSALHSVKQNFWLFQKRAKYQNAMLVGYCTQWPMRTMFYRLNAMQKNESDRRFS